MRLMADIGVMDSEFLVDMQKYFLVFLGPSNACKITKELVLPWFSLLFLRIKV
jgi:hypothetical protein